MFKKTVALWAALACLAALGLPDVSAQTFLIGDVNQDTLINFGDIPSLITVLQSGQYQAEADVDGNGVVNFSDIQPFIDLMASQSVPVSTPTDLERIRTSPKNNFHLTNDIDLATIANFQPIGTNGDPFEATLEGNGHAISNLTIDACPQSLLDTLDASFNNIGLFAFTDGATIRNLNLQSVSIFGSSLVGSLVGQCRQSTVTGCTAAGVVGGLRQVGGLIGFLGDSDVANCSTDVKVEYCEVVAALPSGVQVYAETFWFGGLVGHTHPYRFPGRNSGNAGDGSSLTSCVTFGDVCGSFIAGGVVGNLHGTSADRCFALGNVETEYSVAGGLIGYVQVEPGIDALPPTPNVVTNSVAFGDVKCNAWGTPTGGVFGLGGRPSRLGLRSSAVGGFVGYLEGELDELGPAPMPLSEIQNCSAEGDVTSLETNRVIPIPSGGFVGFTEVFTLISNCQSSGDVLNEFGGSNGGFIGWGEGTVEDSESWGDVVGNNRSGGFAGQVASTRGGTGNGTGPFRGQFLGCVSHGSIQSNAVTPFGSEEILGLGGFVGYSFGGVEFANCDSYGATIAISQVSGFVGGFIGQASNDTITQCSSSGTVFCKFGGAGGFIGRQRLKDGLNVSDCYSTGDVVYTGNGTPQFVGGFVGTTNFDAYIDRCYSAGNIDAPNGTTVRGFAGSPFRISFTDCYWDTMTAGPITGFQPSGVNGRTTAQMQQQATFVGWDFNNIWDIVENVSYPFFK